MTQFGPVATHCLVDRDAGDSHVFLSVQIARARAGLRPNPCVSFRPGSILARRPEILEARNSLSSDFMHKTSFR